MASPATISDLPTPAFLIDIDVLKKNCQRMIDTCKRLGVDLRPHMKTNKTIEGGEIATGGTKRRISVSTISEAEFFASHGFDDILYAYPITKDKLERCKDVADKLEKFILLFDNAGALDCLKQMSRKNGRKWSVLMDVDVGQGRTGVQWDSEEAISLARCAVDCEAVEFEGLYAHCGHSYRSHGQEELHKVGENTAEKFQQLKQRLKDAGIECKTVGTGSTPSCNNPVDKFATLTELHPGNYVFNDYMQFHIGSCELNDIACRVATRVVTHKPSKNQMVVDCGYLALGHDGMQKRHLLPQEAGFCLFQDNPNLNMTDLSQELGKVQTHKGDLEFSKYPIGKMLFIYPFHSCLTAALHPEYYIHSGEKIIGKWRPVKGWY